MLRRNHVYLDRFAHCLGPLIHRVDDVEAGTGPKVHYS